MAYFWQGEGMTVGLELVMLPPQPLKVWDDKYALRCLVVLELTL